jgi:hypothetical protein
MRTSNRIGPHNSDVVSVLVGCLLGDAYAYQTKGEKKVQVLNKVVVIKTTNFSYMISSSPPAS